MHFRHDRQGGAITAAMPRTPGLLPPLARIGQCGRPRTVRTRRFFAFGAVEPLGQVADGALEGFHVSLQGRFPFHKPRVLGPPVVRLPLELNIVLLRQHHCLLGKGRGMLSVGWCKLGGGNELWLCTFHSLWVYQLFMESPIFSDGHDGVPEYLLKFFRKLLKGLTYVPRVIITDKLKSYGAAKREILP